MTPDGVLNKSIENKKLLNHNFSMKRYVNLFLTLLIFTFSIQGPTKGNSLDSLEMILNNSSSDTFRINILNKIADLYTNRDMKRALHLTDSIVQLSLVHNHYRGIIEALQTKGFVYAVSGRFEKSKSSLDSAMNYLKKFPDDQLKAHVLFALGIAYIEEGRKEQAESYFLEAHNIKMKNGSPGDLIKSYNGLYNLYQSLGNPSKALEALINAKKISDTISNLGLKLLPLYGLGNFYSSTGDFQKALEFQLEAESISNQLGHSSNQAHLALSMGGTYLRLKDYKKALIYYERGLELIRKLGQRNVIATTLRDLSIVHRNLGNQDQVISHLKQALQVYDGQETDCDIVLTYSSLGQEYVKMKKMDSARLYSKLAVTKARRCRDSYNLAIALKGYAKYLFEIKKLTLAIQTMMEAYDIADQKNILTTKKDIAQQLSIYLEKDEQYKEALRFHKIFQVTNDSIFNKENTQAIVRMESRFQYEKEKEALISDQEKQELILNQKIEQQRIIQYSAFAGAFLILLLAINYYRSYQLKKQDGILLAEKNDQILKQSEALRKSNNQLMELSNFKDGLTHMIAHDMKNPLNVIIGLSDDVRNNKNLGSINSAGRQILNMVTNMLDIQKFEQAELQLHLTTTNIKQLVQAALFQVELLAHTKNLTLEVSVSGDEMIECNDDMMIRVIVNILTNAIKYSPVDGLVTISSAVSKDRKQVILNIEDKGQGIEAADLLHVFEKFWQVRARSSGVTMSTGLGLTFCKMAVEAHNGSISVDSDFGKGSRFTITLPTIKEVVNHDIQLDETMTHTSNEPIIVDSEKTTLKKYADHLKKLKVYQASEINHIIDQIENHNLQSNWQEQLKVAVYQCDKDKFEELVNMI